MEGDVFTQDFIDNFLEYKRIRRSTRSACARTPTSSSSTTTSEGSSSA